MNEKEIKKDLATASKGIMQNNDSEYVRLVSHISGLWEKAKYLGVIGADSFAPTIV